MQAAILLSLVNDLLDISSVRHEIDKREAAGQWVAGRGGAGGSFPMRSEEERVRRATADSDAEVQIPSLLPPSSLPLPCMCVPPPPPPLPAPCCLNPNSTGLAMQGNLGGGIATPQTEHTALIPL